MANIDINLIEGYGEMTAEEKIKALEGFDVGEVVNDIERYKNATTKANKEAADWKKKYNALLSDEELKKSEIEDEMVTMKNELSLLRKEKTVSEHKAKFLSLGYDEALAEDTALAMADGEVDKVFANQKKFLDLYDKNLKSELLQQTPTPPAGGGNQASFEKEIKTAQEQGDMVTVAALIRQQAELEK